MSKQQTVKLPASELEFLLEVVEEMFWDHHSAGMLPGVGYNHKGFYKISDRFGWRNTHEFQAWSKDMRSKLE